MRCGRLYYDGAVDERFTLNLGIVEWKVMKGIKAAKCSLDLNISLCALYYVIVVAFAFFFHFCCHFIIPSYCHHLFWT